VTPVSGNSVHRYSNLRIAIAGFRARPEHVSTHCFFPEIWAKESAAVGSFCWLFPFERTSVYQHMLRYAIIFLIIALVAEAFGASGVAGEAAWIAHVLLIIAVIFIIISFVSGRRGPPTV
jgi:uncharacterized membrane protein YtjA (UPF0391 family)